MLNQHFSGVNGNANLHQEYEPPPPYIATYSTASTATAPPFSPENYPNGGPNFENGNKYAQYGPQPILQQPVPQPPPPPPNLSAPAGLFLPNSTTLIVSSAQVPPISGASASATYTNAGGVNPIKVIYAAPLGPNKVCLECSNCRATVVTKPVPTAGLLTWLLCGGLALVGCWPCCLIPFCVNSCQDREHYCPNCKAYIGRYRKI